MLNINDATRVLLTPTGESSFEILEINDGGVSRLIAILHQNVYELRTIGPVSSADVRPEPRFPSGEPVKSLILEPQDTGVSGAVISNPNLINFTKFDLTYPILKWVSKAQEKYSLRYHTEDDLKDQFASHLGIAESPLLQKFTTFVKFDHIFLNVTDNGEMFYKLDADKIHMFLSMRVEKLKLLLLNSDDHALSKMIRETLRLDTSDVPDGIIELQTLKYSVDFIFGSYLDLVLRDTFLKRMSINFEPLTNYLNVLESKEKAANVIEESLSNPAFITKQSDSKVKTTPKNKKVNKKVAIGKGALDSFFKRQ